MMRHVGIGILVGIVARAGTETGDTDGEPFADGEFLIIAIPNQNEPRITWHIDSKTLVVHVTSILLSTLAAYMFLQFYYVPFFMCSCAPIILVLNIRAIVAHENGSRPANG